jgi:indole-3-glycerol phosphate synthase
MLDRIVQYKVNEVAARKARLPMEKIRAAAGLPSGRRDFAVSLRRPDRVTVIAEIKRASPSRGPIRLDVNPATVGKLYQEEGAAAISVLTDTRFFCGSPDFLGILRGAVEVPLLCKDFILDPYQIFEANLWGADAALLITRLLGDTQLKELVGLSREIGMEPLVEVRTEEEVQRALAAGATVIGINNRDLDTFKTDIEVTLRLRRNIPPEVVVVSESGISTPAAVQTLKECGVDAVLVGEALMYAGDIAGKLRELITACAK